MSVRGFEPRTTWLKVKCSTTWATRPYSMISSRLTQVNWASWIRTSECRSQSPVPYRLAIAHRRLIADTACQYEYKRKGWVVGLEPTISRTTIWRADQLHHTHHNEPGGIRTHDLRLRRPLLYPAELQTLMQISFCNVLTFLWESGWWESNSRIQLGRLVFYHWTTPARHMLSGWQDSNLRPPGPKPGALAKLSHTPASASLGFLSCPQRINDYIT